MVDGSGKVLDDFDEVTPSTVSSNVIILEDRDVSYVADFILAEGTKFFY